MIGKLLAEKRAAAHTLAIHPPRLSLLAQVTAQSLHNVLRHFTFHSRKGCSHFFRIRRTMSYHSRIFAVLAHGRATSMHFTTSNDSVHSHLSRPTPAIWSHNPALLRIYISPFLPYQLLSSSQITTTTTTTCLPHPTTTGPLPAHPASAKR
jgi:hypothetical protein